MAVSYTHLDVYKRQEDAWEGITAPILDKYNENGKVTVKGEFYSFNAVSYTHLDVYKRQEQASQRGMAENQGACPESLRGHGG